MPSPSLEELRQRLVLDLADALAPLTIAPDPASLAPAVHGRPEVRPAMLTTKDPVVLPERIADVARYVRDTLGFVLLSNITAVDFLAEGVFELVYHFYRLEGGPPLVIKVRVPRSQPVLPTLSLFWPGASLQEREAFDLFGVVFEGHPYMRRIYMWDEFEGFPMRKDFPRQGDKYLGEED